MADSQSDRSDTGSQSQTTSPWRSRIGLPTRVAAVLGRRKGVWVATAAVLALGGVLAAVLGARAVAHSDAERGRLAAHLSSAEIASALRLAIRREEDLTVSMSAFVAGNPNVTAAEFDTWVESTRAMQRYPELQNIGLVTLVKASQLTAFEARMAADPLRPRGPQSEAPAGSLQILPAGNRPYYCIAVAGLASNAASYLPAGLDYCELIKTMITARDSGLNGYAPIVGAGATALGVGTPVYRGGITPSTVGADRAKGSAGNSARGSPQRRCGIPLRLALLTRRVHQRHSPRRSAEHNHCPPGRARSRLGEPTRRLDRPKLQRGRSGRGVRRP